MRIAANCRSHSDNDRLLVVVLKIVTPDFCIFYCLMIKDSQV